MSRFNLSTRILLVTLLFFSTTKAFAQKESERPLNFEELTKSGKSIKPPKAIKQDPPRYPYDMSKAGLIGAVKVEFVIGKDGNVTNAYVVSSNNPGFEHATLDAIMRWKFEPAEVDGQKVNLLASQLIEFNLEPGGQAEQWRVTKGKEHDKLPPELRWEKPPEPVNTLFPVYPFEQLKNAAKGTAKLIYIVSPTGQVVVTKTIETTSPEFGFAAQAALDAWRFNPATRQDGTPCYARLYSEYEFQPTGRGGVPVSEEALGILKTLKKKPKAIMTLKDLDVPLKPLSRRPPVYPTALKEAGQDGSAEIEFFVDQNGDAQLPRIISSTATEFGYAAVQAVATWRFEAPRKGGKAVVVRARIPIEFSSGKHGAEAEKP